MPPSASELPTGTKADVKSSSAWAATRQNFNYLFNPRDSSNAHPSRLRTRALLRTVRFLGIFIFWRAVRYAKYALVGIAMSAVGATAFGGLVSGAGFILAPPGILASIAIGAVWTLGKYGFKKLSIGEKVAAESQHAKRSTTTDGSWRDVQGPRANPW